MTDPSVPHAGTREDQVQQIADLVAHHGIDYRPMCQDIARAVLGLIDAGWVPKQALHQLAQEWEEQARHDHTSGVGGALAHALGVATSECAAELRALTRQEPT